MLGTPGCQSSAAAYRGSQLVAGGVVGDRTDDAAVARVDAVGAGGVVGVHAPVHGAAEADDVEGADVDAGALDGGRGRLVVGLVGDPGRVEGVAVGLHDRPAELAERVAALEAVVAVGVRRDGGLPAVHEGVVTLAHRQREVRDALLAGVLDPVAVGVVEDVAGVLRPPAGHRHRAHGDGLAARDGHLLEGEQVVLRLVPPGQRVVAVGHAADVEPAVGARLADPDGLVAVLQVAERQPGVRDRALDLGAGEAVVEVVDATLRRDVVQRAHDPSGDVAGRAGVQRLPVLGRPGVAEQRGGHGLAREHELGVVPGRALHHPGVPVVVALERGGLHPVDRVALRRRDVLRVAVRAHVRVRHDAVGVADALPADGLHDRCHVGVERGAAGSRG